MSTAKRIKDRVENTGYVERLANMKNQAEVAASINPEKRFHVIEHFSYFSSGDKAILLDILENVDEKTSLQLQEWMTLATVDDQGYFLGFLSSMPILHQQRCIQLIYSMVNFANPDDNVESPQRNSSSILDNHPRVEKNKEAQKKQTKTQKLSEVARVFSQLKVCFELSNLFTQHVENFLNFWFTCFDFFSIF
jgi:hypothetical protein